MKGPCQGEAALSAHRHTASGGIDRSAHATGPGSSPLEFTNLIGCSAAFLAAVDMGRRAAAHPLANILLTGETGTGKELFARAIHYAGRTAGEPFVAINCAAIPETLLESELFGHEKGAFTDARTPKRGLLEVAGGGTVMLDEVNELPLNLQPKLLRVLEERRVRRLGALSEYTVGCRIIAATNRDLATLVDSGAFRGDLYYRLNVVRIELPPLRERHGDLDLLAEHFVRTISADHGLPTKRISRDGFQVLQGHPFLGNLRELKNTIESAIVLCDGDEIRPEHIRLRKRTSVPVSGDAILTNGGTNGHSHPVRFIEGTHALAWQPGDGAVLRIPEGGVTLESVERLLIEQTLEHAGGNRSLAARMLGISRPTVLRKMARYRLA